MYIKRQRGWEKHLDFILLDMLCMLIAFLVGYSVRHGWHLRVSLPRYYWYLLVVLCITNLSVSFIRESYKSIVRRGYLTELKESITHCLVVDGVLLLVLFFAQQTSVYSRETLGIYAVLQILLTYGVRCLRKHCIRKRMLHDPDIEQMLILTDTEHAKQCVEELSVDCYRNYRVIGAVVCDNKSALNQAWDIDATQQSQSQEIASTQEIDIVDNPQDSSAIKQIRVNHNDRYIAHVPVVCTAEQLPQYLLNHVVDSVFMQLDAEDAEIKKITKTLVESGVTVHINLLRLPHELPNRTVEHIGNYTVLTSGMRLATKRQLFYKRALDILGGMAGVLLTLIATILFGPIIFLQSPGPIFFAQTRVGKNGRKFKIFKLRSMYLDAEERKKELMSQNKMDGLMFKMDNDPRIIPIGKFIRKYSIDELPQFFNVLKGDMSLVGTRPPTVEEFDEYELHHRGRLSSKPGITGLWQVSGRSDITDFEEVVRLDTEYIMNWSIGEDVRILWKTVKMVLGGDGAV